MALRSVGPVPGQYLESSHCQKIADLEGVRDLVLLPDVHIKQKYIDSGYQCIVPSSSVVVSDPSRLYPQVRSRGIGCGMAIWPLGIAYGSEAKERHVQLLNGIYSTLLGSKPILTQLDETASRYLDVLPNLVRVGRYGLRRRSYLSTIIGGAAAYLSKTADARENNAIEKFEKQGNHIGGEERSLIESSTDYLSGRLRKMRDFSGGDFRAGLWLEGNHYVELQEVSDVYDAELLGKAGMNHGEAVVMSHSCGYGLEWILAAEIVERRIRISDFKAIAVSERDYGAVRVAVAMLKNIGSLRRAIFYKRLLDSASIHNPGAAPRLLAECNHNDIEWAEDKLVYRHNALKLRAGHFQIISGLANHPSYLITRGDRADQTYDTVGHGLGEYLRKITFEEDPSRSVLRLGVDRQRELRGLRKRTTLKSAHLAYYRNDPGDKVMRDLESLGIIKLVAKLSPRISVNHEW